MSETQNPNIPAQLPAEISEEFNDGRSLLRRQYGDMDETLRRMARSLLPMFKEDPHRICAHMIFLLKVEIEEGIVSEQKIRRALPSEMKDATKSASALIAHKAREENKKKKITIDTDGHPVADDAPNEAAVSELRNQMTSVKAEKEQMQMRLTTWMPVIETIVKTAVLKDGKYIVEFEAAYYENIKRTFESA